MSQTATDKSGFALKRISMLLLVLLYSAEAFLVKVRLLQGPLGSRIRPLGTTMSATKAGESEAVRSVDMVMRMMAPFSGHICYYRAYSIVNLLRSLGLEAVMNVGGRGLHDPKYKKAHCWVTIEGKTVHEMENEFDLYPERIGTNKEGTVQYWLGPAFDREAALSRERIKAQRA